MRIERKKNLILNAKDEAAANEYETDANKNIVKRRYMNDFRPPNYWNFFEDGLGDNKVEHVLRYNADPNLAYSDGRIGGTDEILDLI